MSARAFRSAAASQENHARACGRGIPFDFGKGVAALNVGNVGGKHQEVDAGLLDKLKPFFL